MRLDSLVKEGICNLFVLAASAAPLAVELYIALVGLSILLGLSPMSLNSVVEHSRPRVRMHSLLGFRQTMTPQDLPTSCGDRVLSSHRRA